MIAHWIYEENLKPLLETLSASIDYNFDESDWTAINFGLKDTDDEKDQWYEYALIGRQSIELKIAADDGSSVVHVQLRSDSDTELKAEIAMSIFQNYKVK